MLKTPRAADIRTRAENLDIIYKGIQKHLVPICGTEITSVPLYVDANSSTPAYTMATGLYLSQQVVDNDPYNAHVYIMHEIMHHVGQNNELTMKYPADMVNYAEDYWGNFQMRKVWGFDVRKVKYKGLYNKRLGTCLPHQICEHFTKHPSKNREFTGACGGMGFANVTIRRIANRIRKQFNLGKRFREPRLIECDAVDLEVFDTYSAKLSVLGSIGNIPVDLPNLVEGVFMRAYLEKPFIRGEQPFLSMQQAFAYCWDTQKIKKGRIDPDRAALATVYYIQYISMFDHIIKNWIGTTRTSIAYCTQQSSNKRLKSDARKKYRKRLARAQVRLQRLLKIPPLFETLKKHPVQRRLQKTNKTNAMKLVKPPSKRQLLVSVKPNESTRLISLISSMTARKFHTVGDLMDDILASFKDLAEMENEYDKIKKEQEKQKKKEEENKQRIEELVKATGKTVEEIEAEEEDEETVEEAVEVDPENIELAGTPRGGNTSEGSGKEKGKPTPTVFEIMSKISDEQLRKLQNILARMSEFETALQLRKNKQFDEYATTIDIIPAFGNDVDRIHQNEVALLHNPATKMLFYSKLADNSLDMHFPQDNKRQPVVILVDASGSMSGNPYETATGFALAMLKKLAADKRGGGFIIFSDNIAFKFVLKQNEELRVNEILQALLTPQFGGTNFDVALFQAYEIKRTQKWKAMTTIMVTDGGDHVSPAMFEYLKTVKSREDRLMAALVKGSDHGFRGLNDATYQVNKNEMTNTLTKIGNSAL